MSDTTETVETENNEQSEAQETESQEVEAQDSTDVVDDPVAGLKSALQKERNSNKANAKRIKELEREISDRDKTPDEKALDEARREAVAEALSAANKRILSTEIRAIAKGRLNDPADALLYLDADSFVDDDGEVDVAGIEDAVSELLKQRPYLGVDSGEKFRGSADQGSQGKQSRPSQLTATDLKNMTPAEIVAAQERGQLKSLMGG